MREDRILKEDQAALGKSREKKVLYREETTYRIISRSVAEYHFIVPFELPEDDRVEVGQIFSSETAA